MTTFWIFTTKNNLIKEKKIINETVVVRYYQTIITLRTFVTLSFPSLLLTSHLLTSTTTTKKYPKILQKKRFVLSSDDRFLFILLPPSFWSCILFFVLFDISSNFLSVSIICLLTAKQKHNLKWLSDRC